MPRAAVPSKCHTPPPRPHTSRRSPVTRVTVAVAAAVRILQTVRGVGQRGGNQRGCKPHHEHREQHGGARHLSPQRPHAMCRGGGARYHLCGQTRNMTHLLNRVNSRRAEFSRAWPAGSQDPRRSLSSVHALSRSVAKLVSFALNLIKWAAACHPRTAATRRTPAVLHHERR